MLNILIMIRNSISQLYQNQKLFRQDQPNVLPRRCLLSTPAHYRLILIQYRPEDSGVPLRMILDQFTALTFSQLHTTRMLQKTICSTGTRSSSTATISNTSNTTNTTLRRKSSINNTNHKTISSTSNTITTSTSNSTFSSNSRIQHCSPWPTWCLPLQCPLRRYHCRHRSLQILTASRALPLGRLVSCHPDTPLLRRLCSSRQMAMRWPGSCC
mmetsp:Transcript_88730/g.147385  ORF Transcript_88730/g.147385 Transcript_88730/m.147385 type:complete len:213 (-) Transcript_88730:1640-2278(-)